MYCCGRYLADFTKKSKHVHSSSADLPYAQSNSVRPRGCFSPSDSSISLAACKATIQQASLFRNCGNHSLQSPVVEGQACQRHGPAGSATAVPALEGQEPAASCPRPCSQTRPEGSTLRCKSCSSSCIFTLHFCCFILFKSLQDDRPAPATKSQLKLTMVFRDEERALQTAESQGCFLMIFFALNLPPSVPPCARQTSNYQEIPSLLIYISMNAISEQPTVTGSYYFHRK